MTESQKDRDDALVDGLVERMAAREEAREREPYEGFLGVLPDWFPAEDRNEFLRLRNNLLDEVYPWSTDMRELDPRVINRKIAEVVRTWIDAYRSTEANKPGWPEQYEATIGTLARYYSAFLRGPTEGERFLLGERHAKTMQDGRQSAAFREKAGTARAGRYGVVRQVVERLKPKDINDFVNQIQNDRCLDILASDSLGPLDFDFQDVDEDESVIYYRSEGRDQQVSFKTIQNHIAALK